MANAGGAFIGGGFGLVGLSWAQSRRTLMALRIENRVPAGMATPAPPNPSAVCPTLLLTLLPDTLQQVFFPYLNAL